MDINSCDYYPARPKDTSRITKIKYDFHSVYSEIKTYIVVLCDEHLGVIIDTLNANTVQFKNVKIIKYRICSDCGKFQRIS